MENQYVIFDLVEEQYGVDIANVESIIKIQTITSVPHAPPFVNGVTNLRGAVLPVIDLRKRFGLLVVEANKDTRIIVVDINGANVGMVVDGVSEVLTISDEAVEPVSPVVTSVDSAFITGIAMVEDNLVILLDLAHVLSLEEQADLKSLV